MTALALLLAAIWFAWHAPRQPWAAAAALVAAAAAGTTLPDLDLTLGLGHRSGLTHSILPAAALAWRREARAPAAGLALGIALHLSADLFPHAMRGFALIKLPGLGSLGRDGSYAWLLVNMTAALLGGAALATASTPRRLAPAALAAVALLGTAYLFRTDGGWTALALFVVASWLLLRRAQSAGSGVRA